MIEHEEIWKPKYRFSTHGMAVFFMQALYMVDKIGLSAFRKQIEQMQKGHYASLFELDFVLFPFHRMSRLWVTT